MSTTPLIRRFAAPFDSLRSLRAGFSPRKREKGTRQAQDESPSPREAGRGWS